MTAIRFIAGSGRSGTTWIQDALAAANGLRPVFEPLHPYVSKVGDRYAHRALPADEAHPDLQSFLLEASGGGGPWLWTRYRQQWRWLVPPASKFSTRQDAGRFWRHWAKLLWEFPKMTRDGFRREPLVKCIRANLMLPWLARNLGCRIVLVVRHPGAVVESELRSGWNASFALDRFRKDARLHQETRGRYEGLLARKLSPVEALTVRWIVENQWVVERAAADGLQVIHYEELRSSSPDGWMRLCSTLDLGKIPDRRLLTRPSQQSGGNRPTVPLEQSRTPRWMASLTEDQCRAIRGILDAAECDLYDLRESMPRHRAGSDAPSRASTAHT